jgi:pimeloyl-ACP methyl ester carboxylesterase
MVTSKSNVSRREVAKWAAVASSSFTAPVAAAQNNHRGIRWFSGLTDPPVTYFDAIEPTGGRTGKPPMFLIHGGAHTGACYLMTADGRLGWAHAFAQAGYRVVIPDWPGSGRSGYVPYDDLTGETVVAGLGKALIAVGEPAVVMTYSMSGPYGWKLLEQYGDHVAKIVAVAPGPPGNIQAAATIANETPEKLD